MLFYKASVPGLPCVYVKCLRVNFAREGKVGSHVPITFQWRQLVPTPMSGYPQRRLEVQ